MGHMSSTATLAPATYRKTKQGDWVAYGPAAHITAGTEIVITQKNGTQDIRTVERTGRTFQVDGTTMVYGYLAARTSKTQVKASGPRLATPKQIALLNRLINDGRWHDSDAGQGFNPPTEAEVDQMTAADASELIDDLLN